MKEQREGWTGLGDEVKEKTENKGEKNKNNKARDVQKMGTAEEECEERGDGEGPG